MGIFQRFLAIFLPLAAAAAAAAHQREITPNAPFPARQIAYNLRLYHQAATNYKIANPGLDGILAVPVPAFLTEFRAQACAGPKTVATYGVGLTAAENRDIFSELSRQSVSPPELGSVAPANAMAALPPGVGLSEGPAVATAYGPLTPPCPIAAGAPVIITQALP